MQPSTVSASERPSVDRSRTVAPDPSLAVQARELSKDFVHPWTRQVARALDGLSLEVRRGEVVGLLGPNGAGKTTTLKLLTGLLKPTRGRAWLFGRPIEDPESRRSLGFLPEQPYFYDHLNGQEYLELTGRLCGLDAREAASRARTWLGRVGLGARPRLGLRKYSKGMLQRLGLAAALVHGPELLILDEPMSGLDPFGRRDVRELIHEQREHGTTVLFSSHILPDVEMLCDQVAVLLGGRLRRMASVGELMHDGHHPVEIRCVGAPMLEIPAAWRDALTRRERAGETALTLTNDAMLQDVLRWLVDARVAVRAVTPQRLGLEELLLAEAQADGTPASDGDRRLA